MTKQKIVFFDLDGTLMSHDKTILPSTKEALHALRDKGIITVICTGRAPRMFQELLTDLEFDSYVSMNGQHVVYECNELFSNPMNTEILTELSALAKENGHGITYSNSEVFAANAAEHPLVVGSLGRLKLKYPEVDAEIFAHSPVHQIQLYGNMDDLQSYKDRYQEDYVFIHWDENAVDMLPKGASKAVGIRKLMEHLDIPIENSYAFGDGPNDFEMLEFVGTGIAMGNAIPELKEKADLVTDTCSNDGILKGLLACGLLEEAEVSLHNNH
ncbi:Cof-type HAD-IIB family hydrolase [Sporosarcina aquimarina]|uniref:Cof-type HAD-IIB family hydrolase n=1 Tax=Sporosarcina aquimarina TaxID=114975 RepID=UPI00203C20FD|nr:Cof-type HAD-IIB family hydrolase [Sporosarcina aquimarina]MCM3758608.1 Cof-type HAD-IIB family hydrolase [Sporosarcina aquimarina]